MLNMSGVEGLLFLNALGMKLDIKKAVLLFASIHLLIAWVAERQSEMKSHKIIKPAMMGIQVVQGRTDVSGKFISTNYPQP